MMTNPLLLVDIVKAAVAALSGILMFSAFFCRPLFSIVEKITPAEEFSIIEEAGN